MHHSFSNQLFYELKSAAFGYPKFVYFNAELQRIPVFVFHTIEPELFESQLIYLKDNGYKTLSVDEYVDGLNDKAFQKSKSVLLTIDDARSSVWRYAFPLLKKYEMKATVFVIPGLTLNSDSYRKNLLDVWNGKSTADEIFNSDPEDNSLCTWQEIITMYSSGLVDIESHTLFHKEIFSTDKIVDFISDETPYHPYNYSGSPYFSNSEIGRKIVPEEFIGLPLFESAPLMLAGPELKISPEFIFNCKRIYSEKKLNDNSLWKEEIVEFCRNPSNKKKYFCIEPDSKREVSEDLIKARDIIQDILGKSAGNHLCLPWTIGNEETIKIVKNLGIKSCFWGVINKDKILCAEKHLLFRIKNDFIFRLPGENRRSLSSIYIYKTKRRLSKKKVF